MEFKQFRFFGGTRKYQLIDGKQLKTTFSKLSGKNIEIVELYSLENKYERIVYREIKWVLAAICTALITCKFAYDAFIFSDPFPVNFALFFATFTAILVAVYFINHHDQLVFRLYQSSDPGLLIWATKPTEEEAIRFADNLVKSIDKLKVNPNLTLDKKLEIYANSLSFLCDEEVISEKEAEQIYERTRKRFEKLSKGSVVSIAK